MRICKILTEINKIIFYMNLELKISKVTRFKKDQN